MAQPLTQQDIFDVCWEHAQTFPEVNDAIHAHIQEHFPNDFQDVAAYLKAFSETVEGVNFPSEEALIESLNNMIYLGL